MKHIVCFSGGKDSTALVLWAKETLGVPGRDFTAVFVDTKWEHDLTYWYVEYINQKVLNGTLVRLASATYPEGFVQLCIDRKGFPSTKRRFCTEELKVFPLHEYYENLEDGEITSYQGVRADESEARSKMCASEWVDAAGGYTVVRPLFRWTTEQVFDIHRRYGIEPNPLYLRGSSRVGCFPCINTGLAELKRMISTEPGIKEKIISLEKHVNENVSNKETRKWPATFWASGTIPARYCSLSGEVECRKCEGRGWNPATDIKERDEAGLGLFGNKHVCNLDQTCCKPICEKCSGRGKYTAYVPTAEDVFKYVESVDYNQLPLLVTPKCMSVYNLCE